MLNVVKYSYYVLLAAILYLFVLVVAYPIKYCIAMPLRAITRTVMLFLMLVATFGVVASAKLKSKMKKIEKKL